MGGRKGIGCSTASHLATAVAAAARQEGRTTLFYFVDLTAAFSSCVRTTALPLGGEEATEDLRYIADHAELPEGLRPLATFVLAQPAVLAHLQSAPHLVASLVEAHRVAYFTVNQSPLAARARRGTRPGNALADAVLALSFTRPLEVIAEYIRTNDLILDSQPSVRVFSEFDDEPQPTTGVAYAGDGLLMAVLRSNKAIARKAERLRDVVHVALTTAGYKPN